MFYAGGEVGEEDIDFNVTSTSSNKLATLFSFDSPKEQSLTYTAPKQPKKPAEEQKSAGGGGTSSVLCAFVVHAYKFENQQYASQGKLGAAIIANHEALSYKLILYKGKQQHVTFATINLAFSLKVQANKYASFYDDQRESWSILFDSEQNSIDFAKQIALAKANSSGSNLNSVVVQDLTFGDEGRELEVGDSAEVQYSGWLLQNYSIGQMFDTNNGSEKLMKIKLGKTKIIKGWEEGLIGVKKNQKRFLIVPPALGYGNQQVPDKVPPNSTLVFELRVTKVKSAKDSSRSATPNSSQEKNNPKKSEPPPKIDSSISSDDSVKARGASISEQLSQQSPKTEKAKIISRMAKMGMPMLPMQGSPVVHQSSESETEDDAVKRRSLTSSPSSVRESSPKPIIKPRPINPSLTSHSETHSLHQGIPPNAVPHHQLAVFQQPYPNLGGMPPYAYPFQPQQPMAAMFTPPVAPPTQPSLNDTHLPILMSENRAQNSEIRMVLAKIGDKVDAVLHKLEQEKSTPAVHQTPYMDSTTLVQNIERIVLENTKWKNDLEEKNQKIHSLNEKICVLLEKNQKLVEESNYIMEKRSDTFQSSSVQSQSRLATLETEKLKLSEELSAALSEVSELKIRMAKSQTEVQTKLENLSDNSDKYRGKLETLRKELEEKNSLLSQLEESLTMAENTKESLTSKLENLEDRYKSAQSSSETLSKILEKNNEELLAKQTETEEEIARLKTKHEEEIQLLKEKIAEEYRKTTEENGSGDSWREEKSRLEKQLASSKEEIQSLEAQLVALRLKLSERNDTPTPSLENKLKRAMTALYRSLQQEIDSGTSYEGEELLQLVLQSIRSITSAILENEASQVSAKEETVQTQNNQEQLVDNNETNDINKMSDEENAPVSAEIQNEVETESEEKLDTPELSHKNSPKQEPEENKSEVEEISSVEIDATEPKKTLPIADVPKASPKIESSSTLSPSVNALISTNPLAVAISILIGNGFLNSFYV